MRKILDFGESGPSDPKHPLHGVWANMIRTAYGTPNSGRYVCDDWRQFDAFRQWGEPLWFPGKRLILLPKEMCYSPATCVFVSGRAATMLTTLNRKQTSYPIGVTRLNDGKYLARGRDGTGQLRHLGLFAAAMDAHRAWQAGKVEALRYVAAQHVAAGDNLAAGALFDYAFSISADLRLGRETTE